VRLAVRIEALVVEGRRGTQAMGRSWELVGGHGWHAFGTLVVAWLITGVIDSLITLPFGDTSWVVQGWWRRWPRRSPALWGAGRVLL
jgi:hypothetical protein